MQMQIDLSREMALPDQDSPSFILASTDWLDALVTTRHSPVWQLDGLPWPPQCRC